mmetsp:Transcript_108153/g.214797  ORF Transcript_108153/g.214797 Transcript_108153/m.214797 type:complete len:82 (+) Transcript_108153:1223-1468(+)
MARCGLKFQSHCENWLGGIKRPVAVLRHTSGKPSKRSQRACLAEESAPDLEPLALPDVATISKVDFLIFSNLVDFTLEEHI